MFLEEIIGEVVLEGEICECEAKLNREDIIGWLKSVIIYFESRECSVGIKVF